MTVRVRLAAALLLLVLFAFPIAVYADGMMADAQCVCQMNPQVQNPPYCPIMPCVDMTSGFATAGHCIAPGKCKGETGGGKGLDAGLGQLGQMLQQLMSKLGQKSPSGGGAGAPPTPMPTTGCPSGTFQTSDVMRLSDPCAQYVAPPVSMDFTPIDLSTSTCDATSQLLGTCIINNNTNINTNTDDTDLQFTPAVQPSTSISGVKSATTTPNFSGLGTPATLIPQITSGVSGDIFLLNNGATISGFSQNAANNSGVAGFYGGATVGAQPQGLAASLCQNRPWAGGFIAALIPASFFDGLCMTRGYPVGQPPAPQAPVVQLQQTPVKPSAPKPPVTATATTTVAAPSSVRIWAVPASVPLDTRTSIFWTTQGVTDCVESSPDGNFSHTSLSGGSATVPLSGDTTFNISCLDSAKNPVTDFVIVHIKI